MKGLSWASVGRITAHAAALLAVSAVAVAAFGSATPASIDDAFIVLVYVRHLLESGSFYYNAGEGHVEGFTSLLDVLFKSALVGVTHGDAIRVAWWCTLVLQAGVGALAYVIGAGLFVRANGSWAISIGAGTLLGIAIGACPALAYGSSFLLETPLFTLAALAAVGAFALGPPARSWPRPFFGLVAVTLIALILARPEGIPLALAVAIAFRLSSPRSGALVLLVTAGSIITLFAFRLRYFGSHWPNSYYAKTSDSRWNEIHDGLSYLRQYWRSREGLLLLAFPAGLLLCANRSFRAPEWRGRTGWVAAFGFFSLLEVLVAGGDCYGGGRFFAVPLCLALLTLAVLAAGLQGAARHLAFASLVVAAALVLSYWQEKGVRRLRPLDTRRFACDKSIAEQLERVADGGTVAQTDYQRLKYFADGLRVLDVTGLNDATIAHRVMPGPVSFGKGDLLETVRRSPQLWVLGHHVNVQARPLSDFSLREVLSDPELSERYFGYSIAADLIDPLASAYVSGSLLACGGHFSVLVRRSFAASAGAAGIRVGD